MQMQNQKHLLFFGPQHFHVFSKKTENIGFKIKINHQLTTLQHLAKYLANLVKYLDIHLSA